MPWTNKMRVYAGIAVCALVVTWFFNFRFMQETGGGFALGAFVAGGYANSAASSLTSDLAFGSTAFLIWMVGEARRLRMRHSWIYVVLLLFVAFGCACPIFLLMRERRLRETVEA